MTVSVRLIEAHRGAVSRITELCKVSGTIPVYADKGFAAAAHLRKILGCKMRWRREDLAVSVSGAKAVSEGLATYATAVVSVTPSNAVPACAICGPQPLAEARAEVRASGSPRSLSFSLLPNPVSLLNAKPTVWLEADVEILDK